MDIRGHKGKKSPFLSFLLLLCFIYVYVYEKNCDASNSDSTCIDSDSDDNDNDNDVKNNMIHMNEELLDETLSFDDADDNDMMSFFLDKILSYSENSSMEDIKSNRKNMGLTFFSVFCFRKR